MFIVTIITAKHSVKYLERDEMETHARLKRAETSVMPIRRRIRDI